MVLGTLSGNMPETISNALKPIIRPLFSWAVLKPAIAYLLPRQTVAQAFGKDHPKHRRFPPETIATPEIKDMPPFDGPFAYLESETYTTHDIFSTILEDVLVEPGNGIVLTSSRKVIAESMYPQMDDITIYGALLNKSFIRRRLFEEPVQEISGYASIYQGLPNGYYHKFIDLVPRCSLLSQPEYADIDNIQLLYSDPVSETETLLVPKLIPDNVTLTKLEPSQLYRVEKLILPTFLTQFGSGYLPQAYIQQLRQAIFPKRPSTRNKRIYISRAQSAKGLKKRHIVNEAELIAALKPLGFEIYELEDFSLEEKVELFYDAEIVVGAYGGGITHVLFSESVKILELQVMAKTQTYYYYLAKALGHDYRFWFSDKANNRENFEVDVSQVLQLLEGWC
ncbi:DUF563 domain-containing protein [Acaryochloris sp. CCMEE 5410]|uniref:glycosyltransferase family 61 protein n=1 Tax=Acaryochloris sp. CCMEE 5410 TaxID=310037 RepID=UPI0003094416|nr:glycosyltransferase family 61 protein [Acaryochloris sp. CCMEE 5410]KAI9133966.1 glycosyltransferase family 61 protein [Acaryochloris sp. CCMEE 5410]